MLKFLLSVRAVLIALVVFMPCAVRANDSCADEANDAISPDFALCSTHAYNIGSITNPTAEERALMKDVIAMKTTLVTQQMYKQYEQMESMLRRFKTQLEKAVTMSKFEMAGAGSEKSSSSSGGYESNNSNIHIAGAQDCTRIYNDADTLKCYQTNIDLIERTSNYGKDVTTDLKEQIKSDYEGLSGLPFEGKDNCGTKYCTKAVKDITKKVFNDCMTEFRTCLQLKYSQYNDRERKYNSKSWR